MKIYYVANARMPNEKAHGIQIAKMCEALILEGADVELIVPGRRGSSESLKSFYHLAVDVPLKKLAVLDLYLSGRFLYGVSSMSFSFLYLLFLFTRKLRGENFILYTIDIDTVGYALLPLLNVPLFSEMHMARKRTLGTKLLFKGVQGIIAINKQIVDELKGDFASSSTGYLVAPNGVDHSLFTPKDEHDARTELGLPTDIKIVLYTGRFLDWKGIEILTLVAENLDANTYMYLVGGTKEEYETVAKCPASSRMIFEGEQPYTSMPNWLSAANVLIVLGTKRDIQSYAYTSPMKLFEYLAMGKPIVASGTPAIREIVSEKEVFFYEPDNVADMTSAIRTALTDSVASAAHAQAALELSRSFSWSGRAERVLAFVAETQSAVG
jgi:glycosyltransferase involved in cell wall biosynthesis